MSRGELSGLRPVQHRNMPILAQHSRFDLHATNLLFMKQAVAFLWYFGTDLQHAVQSRSTLSRLSQQACHTPTTLCPSASQAMASRSQTALSTPAISCLGCSLSARPTSSNSMYVLLASFAYQLHTHPGAALDQHRFGPIRKSSKSSHAV